MRNVLVLTRREISSYFVSPIAYVAMVLFLLLAGVVFAWPGHGHFNPGAPAEMRNIFQIMVIILAFALPVLTMKSLAEELGRGTLEPLMTAPVTDAQVVVGKFLGCWFVYGAMLAPTLLYVVMLAVYGRPDLGPVASGYLGLALLGMFYVAVGMFASSLTRNQVVAGIVAFAALMTLSFFGPWLATGLPSPWRGMLQHAMVPMHYTDFGQGVVDLVHVIYFVALTAFFLFLTVKVLESRRWR